MRRATSEESSNSPTRKARSTPSAIWSTILSVIKTWMWTSGYSFWKATTIGASSESEILGGAASRRFPETNREMVGRDILDGFTDFGAAMGIFQHFRTDVCQTQ